MGGIAQSLRKAAPVPELVSVRMLNEFAYCPRLAFLEWAQSEWAHNTDTVEGRHAHRRVDKPSGNPPAADAMGADEGGSRPLGLPFGTGGGPCCQD